MGFRAGNTVTVNGVAAIVQSCTANTLVVTAPASTTTTTVDITITDRGTGATSTMSAAVVYSPAGAQPRSMRVVSAPTGTVYKGDPAPTPFSVQLLAADGITPVSGITVIISVLTGTATCAQSCTLSFRAVAPRPRAIEGVHAEPVHLLHFVDPGRSHPVGVIMRGLGDLGQP